MGITSGTAFAQRVGIQLGASTPPSEVARIAALAEELGYGEIWLAEDYFELGGIASVAIALGATDTIPIGLGVVAAAARHPAVTAMEFASLAGAHPGRLMAGLGHGAPGWVDQMGLRVDSPIGLLREATTTIRSLLDGEEVSQAGGNFVFERVRLDHPPAKHVPLYYGVMGPASLRLSGELADGTLLGWFSSPGYVRWAREKIDEGRARAGVSRPHHLAVLCLLSTSESDPAAAREDLAGWAAPMVPGMLSSPLLDEAITGTGPPDPLLTGFVASGSADDCIAMINGLLEAGADRVVLVPNPAARLSTAEMVQQIELAARLTRMAAAP
jgi:alkanesulfonate monooxygenase SsuD/methylene tetrahydromethanopterin reductase-like flavin-dependent oxidoreductase (luciferase family)